MRKSLASRSGTKRPFLSVTTTLRLTASTVDRNWMRPSCESREAREGCSCGKENDENESVPAKPAKKAKKVRCPYDLAKRRRPAGWLMDAPPVSAWLGGSKRRRCGSGRAHCDSSPQSACSLPQARSRPFCRFGPEPVFSLNSKTMQKRFFTVREANELLPFLSSRVRDLRLVHRELLAHCASVPSAQEITLRGGTMVPPRYVALLT